MEVVFVKRVPEVPMGEYKPTEIDTLKTNVDFRLVSVGSKNTIVWKDGCSERVTDRKLEKLQKPSSWTTDF